MKVKEIKVEINSNIDEEEKKAKELVDLLERVNELIQSLKTIKIKL